MSQEQEQECRRCGITPDNISQPCRTMTGGIISLHDFPKSTKKDYAPTEESWEGEFDKQFPDVVIYSGGEITAQYAKNIRSGIKSFISTLLSSELNKQREEIRKDLEQISINYGESGMPLKKYAIEYILEYVASLQDPINPTEK